jgi:hypothetical protein
MSISRGLPILAASKFFRQNLIKAKKSHFQGILYEERSLTNEEGIITFRLEIREKEG